MIDDLSYTHRFISAEKSGAAATLLLLHGTGGDEYDLLPLGQRLASGEAVNILSPRGNVLERGMARFFRRLAEGVFDEEDVVRRAGELAGFVKSAAARYGFDVQRVVAVGYSNGANIAAATMLLHTESLAAGIFFHAQPVLSQPPDVATWELGGKEIFLSGGRQDPVVPAEETERLGELLRRAGAEVRLSWQTGGHALTPAEVEEARVWLSEGKLLKN